jgi:hypothetical protein
MHKVRRHRTRHHDVSRLTALLDPIACPLVRSSSQHLTAVFRDLDQAILDVMDRVRSALPPLHPLFSSRTLEANRLKRGGFRPDASNEITICGSVRPLFGPRTQISHCVLEER